MASFQILALQIKSKSETHVKQTSSGQQKAEVLFKLQQHFPQVILLGLYSNVKTTASSQVIQKITNKLE